MRISNSFSFKNHEKNHFAALFSEPDEATRHLLPRTSTGTFKCRTTTMIAPRPRHASRSPSPALPPASTASHVLFNGGSTSRLLCAEPAGLTQIHENEHDGPEVNRYVGSSLSRWCFIVSAVSVLLGVLSFFRAVNFCICPCVLASSECSRMDGPGPRSNDRIL